MSSSTHRNFISAKCAADIVNAAAHKHAEASKPKRVNAVDAKSDRDQAETTTTAA
jgi:hypothetical protein